MRALTAEQQKLAQRATIAPVPVLIITAYSQRGTPNSPSQEDRRLAPWTVQKQWAFSDTGFQLSGSGHGAVIDFQLQTLPALDVQPYLLDVTQAARGIDLYADLSGSPDAGLYRSYSFDLRNGDYDGQSLIQELRANDIDRADVLYGHLLLDRSEIELERNAIARKAIGDIVVLFRGTMQQIDNINSERFSIFCNAHQPWNGLGQVIVNSNTTDSDLFDTGSRYTVPVVYGQPTKVPAIPFEVGFITSLAEAMDTLQSTVELTDAPTGTIASGSPMIVGGELMNYVSNVNTQVVVARSAGRITTHSIGEVVFFVSQFVSYTMAANAGAVVDTAYIRNPLTDRVFRISGTFGRNGRPFPTDTVGFGYSQTVWSSLLAAAIDNAVVSTQAAYAPSSISETTVSQLYSTLNTIASDPAGIASEGSWSQASFSWTFNADTDDPKLMVQYETTAFNTQTRPPNGTEILKVKLELSVNVLFVPANQTSVVFEGFISSKPWVGSSLPIVTSDPVLQTTGISNFLSVELSIAGQGVTIEDLEQDTIIRAFFSDIQPERFDGGYDALVQATLIYTYGDAPTNALITPAEIQAAAGAAGIEAFANVRSPNATELALEPDYEEPGADLFDTSQWSEVPLPTLTEVSESITAWHRFGTVGSPVIAQQVISFFVTLPDIIDMSRGSTGIGAWMGFRPNANNASNKVVMAVSETIMTSTLPANYTEFSKTPIALGNVYQSDFNSVVNVGTGADLTQIRSIQIRFEGPNLAGQSLDVWSMGALVAQDTLYNVSGTQVPRHPVDHIRRFLTADCNVPTTGIDEASFTAAKLNTPSQVSDVASSDYGELSDSQFIAQIALEGRMVVVSDDNAGSSVYRLIAADSSFSFGASVREVTQYQDLGEQGGDDADVYTRRLYPFDPERPDDVLTQAINVGVDQDDAEAVLPKTTIQEVEDRLGRTVAPSFVLASVRDPNSAIDTASYYSEMHLSGFRVFQVLGVVWIEGYDLEIGDVVTITPEWDVALKCMVTQIVKDHRNETVDLVCIEVP